MKLVVLFLLKSKALFRLTTPMMATKTDPAPEVKRPRIPMLTAAAYRLLGFPVPTRVLTLLDKQQDSRVSESEEEEPEDYAKPGVFDYEHREHPWQEEESDPVTDAFQQGLERAWEDTNWRCQHA